MALTWVTFHQLVICSMSRELSISWKFSVALVLAMKLEIISSSVGSHQEMLRIVAWAIHPVVSTQARDPINQAGVWNTLQNVGLLRHWLISKTLLKLFMIAALEGVIASLLELNAQCYLLLSMAVDRCSHIRLFCQATGSSEERDIMYLPLHSPRWLHIQTNWERFYCFIDW